VNEPPGLKRRPNNTPNVDPISSVPTFPAALENLSINEKEVARSFPSSCSGWEAIRRTIAENWVVPVRHSIHDRNAGGKSTGIVEGCQNKIRSVVFHEFQVGLS